MAGRKWGVTADRYRFCFGVMKFSKSDCCDGYTTANTLKTTALYILNGWVVWYVNISQKVVLKKPKIIPPSYLRNMVCLDTCLFMYSLDHQMFMTAHCVQCETGTFCGHETLCLAHPYPSCLELCLAQRLWLSSSPHLPRLQDFSLASSKVILFLSCHTFNCLLNFLTRVKRKNNLCAWIFVICGII